MGFSEIYLLGCDCTGFVNLANLDKENLNYAYKIDEKERERLKNTVGKDIIWELENYANLFREYEILNEYCKNKNIKLINCTEGGLLSSIERKKLEEVLN